MKYLLILLFLLGSKTIFCQTKITEASKINVGIKVDGKLDETAWANITAVTDFIVAYPDFGKVPTKKTAVKIAYDDAALYIAAIMYDDSKNIRRQLTQRDALERQDCDIFTIGLDTYLDRQNGFTFQVSAAGVQGDARQSSSNGSDISWDAVWQSGVSIQADSWIAEIKIPFSAIRFAKKDVQSWGLQLTRFLRATNENDTWSPQDPNKDGNINQWGSLTALTNIVPPLRLSFLPYVSAGVRQSPTTNGKKNEFLKSGGMDVKLGLNESFTVDVTLVPDFAQVQSDNVFLNLTPFQVRFNDFRPFFTEGTELFNKADLFYSRRIGAEPVGASGVLNFARKNPDYTIDKNPGITRLYNATKLSGRTKNNLGIGFFNAVTAPMKARLTNNITKRDTTIITEPLTNYNVLVFDQALKNRSSFTLTNTNVLRKNNSRNANVTAVDVSLFDKANNYNFSASGRYSKIWGTAKNYDGFKADISAGKISGKWQYTAGVGVESDEYDPNDLGFLQNNNSFEQFAQLSLNYNTPTKKYIRHSYQISINNAYLYKPFNWTSTEINTRAFFLLKNFWDVSFNLNTQPIDQVDFFEARTPGLRLNRFSYAYLGINGSSDSRKKLYVGWTIGGAESRVKDDPYLNLKLNARYRFSDRFQMSIDYGRESDKGQWGFSHRSLDTTLVEDYGDPIIAFRKIKTTNLILSAQYSFTPRMNWTIRMRHNWTNLTNRSFHKLKADGNWDDIAFVNGKNRNFNVFNVDMFYTWDFKWGSRLTFGWKNAIGDNVSLDPYTNTSYTKNLGAMFTNPHSNEVTLKIVYFLDYLDLKKKS
jgi:Domain of unknown function (DUF5916)/Carbohydrate family 9 binding domain-like